MTDHLDPTRPLTERTPDQIGAYADSHLIMALEAADLLSSDRQTAEDYLRDRLAALSDSWPSAGEVAAERARRQMDRLRALLTPTREDQS